MITTHPSAAELARAVAKWIDELRARLEPRDAYLARVAANALAIVERELTQGEAAESESITRFSQLLGHGGDYASLLRELCEHIRSGHMNCETPELLAILRADTLARLAIDQPTYRHESGAIESEPIKGSKPFS